MFEHDQRRGDVFELLADFLADASPLGAAVGADALFGRHVVQDRLAGQARRQRLAAVAFLLGSTRSGRRGWGRLRGRGGCRRGLGLRQDLLGEEQELSGVDPLALLAVALAKELFELVLELLVEMDLLAERLQQLADELMGRFEVVGEWIGEGDHTLYYVDACSIVGAIFSEF